MAEPCGLERRGGARKVVFGWRSRVCWEQKAEPERSWMKCEKQNQNQPKENTRTTKGSEDGRHKHLRKQNISCQKENKSLETIVFSAETNVLRKRLKQHEKNKHSTPMVERFIFPEETKVCLRVCFQ